MLKKADMEARQTELLRLSQNYKIAPIDIWFSIEDFYKRIEPYINFAKWIGHWKAFTCKGLIYCKPDFILDIASALCKESDILDLSFLDVAGRGEALYKTVNLLRDYDCIPDQLFPNRISMKYIIHLHSAIKHKAILTPLKPSGFYNMTRIEGRESVFFDSIKNVSFG